MTPKHWFVFVLFFSMDVRVRASSDLRERPSHCLIEAGACALQTQKSAFHLSKGDSEFHLGPKTLILRHSMEHLEFISGTLWNEKYEKMQVSTVYGEINAKSGPFWVLGDKDKIWIRNINSDLRIHLRDGRDLELPVGFQIWISGMDIKGQSTLGIPEMIPIEEHIRIWSYLFPGSKEEFKKQVEQKKWTWGSLAERSSELYISMVHRQQNLEKQRRNQIQQRELAASEEKKQIKALYTEKAFWR